MYAASVSWIVLSNSFRAASLRLKLSLMVDSLSVNRLNSWCRGTPAGESQHAHAARRRTGACRAHLLDLCLLLLLLQNLSVHLLALLSQVTDACKCNTDAVGPHEHGTRISNHAARQIDCRNRRQRREHAGVRSPQARHTHAYTPVRDHAMYAHRKPSVARRRTSPKRFTPGVRTGTGGRTQSGHTYISQARCCSSAAWCPAWPWCRIRTRNTQYTGDEARVTIGAAGGEGLRVGCARRCKRSRRASRRRGGRPFFSPLEE